MRYMKIMGAYEVQRRPETLAIEWRIHVIDGNGNGVMIEMDRKVFEVISEMIDREIEKEATGGEVVEQ